MDIKEKVTTLDYSEAGIKCSYIFQSLVYYALNTDSIRGFKLRTQKLVKQLKLNKLVYKELANDIWLVKIELDFNKANHFQLRIDRNKPFRECCTFLYSFNNQQDENKKGTLIDVFNVKLLTKQEQDEA